VILYEWVGLEGARYRMATPPEAQHHLSGGWELQRSETGRYWIAMVDYNAGVREPTIPGAGAVEGAQSE
jgi:hypothetical protein